MNRREWHRTVWGNGVPEDFPVPPLHPWRETLERWRREGLPADAEPNAYLGVGGHGVARIPLDCGMEPLFPIRVEESDEHYVHLTDEYGVRRRMRREDYDRTGGRMKLSGDMSAMSDWLAFPVKTRADWQKLRDERFRADLPKRLPADWPEVRRRLLAGRETAVTLVTDFPLLGTLGAVRQLMGFEGMVYAFYDDPSLVRGIVEDLVSFWIALFDALLREVPLDWLIFFEDMSASKGPLVSPATYREFFGTPVERFVRFLKERGVGMVETDSDGNCLAVIGEWMAVGIEGFSPCQAGLGADVDLLKQRFPSLVLRGGIDKRALAAGGETLEHEVRRRFETAWSTGGYIPQIDHSVPPDVSWDNARRFVDLCRLYTTRPPEPR